MFNHKAVNTLIYERGMRQKHLAELADIKPNVLSRYLSGLHKPKIERIAAIAAALEVPIEAVTVQENPAKAREVKQKQMCFCPFCGEKLPA